jgi:hypothetical protein
MSHIVTITTKVRDPVAVTHACRRLGLDLPVHGTAMLFSGEATGMIVRLPGWEYPIVADIANGAVRYDNYNGQWGEQRHLDRFLQMYSVEKARLEARKKGYFVTEENLTDGSVKLRIREGSP